MSADIDEGEMRQYVLDSAYTSLGLNDVHTELETGERPCFIVRWHDKSLGAYLDQHPTVRLAALGCALARTLLLEYTVDNTVGGAA